MMRILLLAILLFDAPFIAVETTSDARQPRAEEEQLTAINILIEPDAAMTTAAEVANARLRDRFPSGFALDETHRPHITCLQQYVRTEDLQDVYAAVETVLAGEEPATWELAAARYDYAPWGELGLAGIVVKPTPDLIRFQKRLIDAVAPIAVKAGRAAAFVTTEQDPDIEPAIIDYVTSYVRDGTGENFNPHVTVGVAPRDVLDKLLEEPFEPFTFSPAKVSVYQLGHFGTARKGLASWVVER